MPQNRITTVRNWGGRLSGPAPLGIFFSAITQTHVPVVPRLTCPSYRVFPEPLSNKLTLHLQAEAVICANGLGKASAEGVVVRHDVGLLSGWVDDVDKPERDCLHPASASVQVGGPGGKAANHIHQPHPRLGGECLRRARR
jgi:hypothetical protein